MTDKKCVPCEGGTPPLTAEEITKYMEELSGEWASYDAKVISKTFVFKNFIEAIDFINKVAEVAESEDHHPDIKLHSYKKVDIELSTHAIGGLSENDFIVASKIDAIG